MDTVRCEIDTLSLLVLAGTMVRAMGGTEPPTKIRKRIKQKKETRNMNCDWLIAARQSALSVVDQKQRQSSKTRSMWFFFKGEN